MTIIDLEGTKKHIVNWLKDYANKAGTKTFVVGLSGGIDSALTALLCKATQIPTLCVSIPCHSSSSSIDRAKSFISEFKLNLIKIDVSSVCELICKETLLESKKVEKIIKEENINNPSTVGGLRSCLRAPILSYLSLSTNGLIVGTGNRSEDNLVRYFQKFGDGCVDICPIADLFKSEVYELFAYMTNLDPKKTENQVCAEIYYSKPTADLLGQDVKQTDEEELKLTYDEIEWGDRQNMKNNIIKDDSDPTRHRNWAGYTVRQKEVIAKMNQMEKISYHKFNPNLPICKIRNIKGFVR